MRTVIAVYRHLVDARGLSQADDELLREHPGGQPERLGVATEKKTTYSYSGTNGLHNIKPVYTLPNHAKTNANFTRR